MFSKEVYKNQNGKVYYILSVVTLVCFIYGISVILRSVFNVPLLFELGDFAIVIGFVCIIGIIGFPLVLALNKGMKNLYVKSELKMDNDKIVYDRQVEYEWTAAGHLNTKNIYEISEFNDYKITSRWIILYGNFKYTEIYKGRNNGKATTKIVKIARVFDTDKEVIDFIKKNEVRPINFD